MLQVLRDEMLRLREAIKESLFELDGLHDRVWLSGAEYAVHFGLEKKVAYVGQCRERLDPHMLEDLRTELQYLRINLAVDAVRLMTDLKQAQKIMAEIESATDHLFLIRSARAIELLSDAMQRIEGLIVAAGGPSMPILVDYKKRLEIRLYGGLASSLH